MLEGLSLDTTLRHTPHHITYAGTYQDAPVIVKRGTSLLHESVILQLLGHPHIPNHIAYQDGAEETLVMARLPGTGLDQAIELDENWHSKPMDVARATRIVDGVGRCLMALCEVNHLYRDLSLAHILVTDAGEFSGLVDYEWCTPIEGNGKAMVSNHAGTWETMAPEEFRRGTGITEASSVYSLGVVLLQLVTGRNPFFLPGTAAPTTAKLRHEVAKLHRTLPAIPAHDAALYDVLRKTLQPESANRYRTLAAFHTALLELV